MEERNSFIQRYHRENEEKSREQRTQMQNDSDGERYVVSADFGFEHQEDESPFESDFNQFHLSSFFQYIRDELCSSIDYLDFRHQQS